MTSRTNLGQDFAALLPADATLYVTVIEHHADGTSTVELPGGQRFRARGTDVAEEAAAFVRGGEVLSEAPAVTPVTLEV